MMGERFRGQLHFDLAVEPGLDLLRVPRLLLQPIVENALTHGLVEGRGRLTVEVRRAGDRLHYNVTDDGTGLPDRAIKQGTGLSNVSRRLELLFPGEHTMSLEPAAPRGTTVRIAFPVRE